MAAPVETSREQLLTLKVMQLSRPKLTDAITFPLDDADDARGWGAAMERAVCVRTGQRNCSDPLTHALVLPQSFESGFLSIVPDCKAFSNIYLGETFTFYVCVHNESLQTARQVLLKAELQTTSQRVTLSCKLSDNASELAPDHAVGQVISHEIKETGQHILVCAVNYTTETGEALYFRKFFKFPVAKPIDVRTKFYNAEASISLQLVVCEEESRIVDVCRRLPAITPGLTP